MESGTFKTCAALALVVLLAACAQTGDDPAGGGERVDVETPPIRYHVVLGRDVADVRIAAHGTLPATVVLAMCAAHPTNGADLTGLGPPRDVAAHGVGGHELETRVLGRTVFVTRRGDGVLVSLRLPLDRASPLGSSTREDGASLQLATLLPLLVGVERPAVVTVVEADGATPPMTSTLEPTADGRGFRAPTIRGLVAGHVEVGGFDEYRLEADGRTLFVSLSGDFSAAAARGLADGCARLAEQCARMTARGLPDRYRLYIDCGRRQTTEGAAGSADCGRVLLRQRLDDRTAPAATVLAAAALMQSALGPPAALADAPLTAPVASRDFWIADGVARYLSALACLRTGVVATDAFLSEMAFLLTESERLGRATGRSVLEAASRPRLPLIAGPMLARPPSSPRGAAAAFALDLELRARTGGRVGLQDAVVRAGAAADTATLLRACRALAGGDLLAAEAVAARTPLDATGLAANAGFALEKAPSRGGPVKAGGVRGTSWRLREAPARGDVRRALLHGAGNR